MDKYFVMTPINPTAHPHFINEGVPQLTLLAPGFFGWCSVFQPPPLHNAFVFKVRLLKFCTELLWDKMNILR